MRISDWSSDVCSSDLALERPAQGKALGEQPGDIMAQHQLVDRLILKAPPDEDHPRAAEELPHHREVEIGAAEAVEHREIVLIGEAAGRRAVDIGLVGEEDAGRMLDRKSTRLNSSH